MADIYKKNLETACSEIRIAEPMPKLIPISNRYNTVPYHTGTYTDFNKFLKKTIFLSLKQESLNHI